MKADEDNGRGGTTENGKFWKLRRFSRNELWKNIGCLLSEPTFGLGGSILWENYPKISWKNRKSYSILSKDDLYEVCELLFKTLYYCYYFYNNTSFPSNSFVEYFILGGRSLGNIFQEASSRRKTRRNISGLGRGCEKMDSTRHAQI